MPIINHPRWVAQVTVGCDDFGPSNQGVNGFSKWLTGVAAPSWAAHRQIWHTVQGNTQAGRATASVCLSFTGSLVISCRDLWTAWMRLNMIQIQSCASAAATCVMRAPRCQLKGIIPPRPATARPSREAGGCLPITEAHGDGDAAVWGPNGRAKFSVGPIQEQFTVKWQCRRQSPH